MKTYRNLPQLLLLLFYYIGSLKDTAIQRPRSRKIQFIITLILKIHTQLTLKFHCTKTFKYLNIKKNISKYN